ncbi:putative helicase mov-10-B.1 isoform X2 [Augochlora pura]
MAKNTKRDNKATVFPGSTHCTSYGVLKLLPIINFIPPLALKVALKNYQSECCENSQLSKDYIKLINSLPKRKEIEPENYMVLFKMFLYLETSAYMKQISHHHLKKHVLTPKFDDFVLNVPTLEQDNPFIIIGDFVKLTTEKDHHYAKIIDIEGRNITISIRNKKIKEKFLNKAIDIKFCPSNWPIKCCHYVLHILYKNNLINSLYPKRNTSYGNSIRAHSDFDWVNKNIKNNPEQKQAVINIVHKTAHPAPYILFGPPGTGKTMTLVESICQIRKRHISKNILVCASSNAAADEITKRLLEFLPCKDIFRIYAPSRNWEDIDKNIQPTTNFVHDVCVFLPKDIFILKKIVIATLITCTRLASLNLKSNHFSYVFIDEASQAIELMTLIPITLVSSLNKNKEGALNGQIILAGDPYQLGPTVSCKKIEHLLGKSMLERLMEIELYKKNDEGQYNPRYITKLVRNFRSPEPILYVPNGLFYENDLLCCRKSNEKLSIPDITLFNHGFPILFIEIYGTENRTENGSIYNEQEIAVVSYFASLFMSAKFDKRAIKEDDIGIITPFKQQKMMIRKKLNQKNLRNITVGTVETFQGQEKDIIIISTARSKVFRHDGTEHIGFLSNPKRFNVAVTRAKHFMIVIGNPKVLCKDICWKTLWNYCGTNNARICFI